MSSIDRRVVEMEFDNRQFERGVRETLASLEALKQGLQLDGAKRGLQEVEEAGRRFSLGNMANAVQSIADKFSILGVVGFTIIQDLTRKAMNYARRLAGMVLDPLVAGGKRRAQNIEQAKFQFRGLGIDIERAMENALYAVEGTAYGLDEAARAASQLSASNVELGDDMRTALRGISGVAAMTNSSYEDISRIFTRVAGQGRVMAVDLNSIAGRGLNAAAELADAMGITESEVRQLVSEGQISFEMFASAMDDAFGENATKANETYSGSLANVRAALSRIGAMRYEAQLEQMRDLFNALQPAINKVAASLEPVIRMFNAWTGRRTNALIQQINGINFDNVGQVIMRLSAIVRNTVRGIMSVLNPIRDAFRQIFPPATIDQIDAFLLRIQSLTASLKMGETGANNLRRTFAGVFAIFSIGWQIVKAAASAFLDLFGVFSGGNWGILEVTANIGDFFVALDQAIKNGEGLGNFFKGFGRIIGRVVEVLRDLSRAVLAIFDFDAPSAERFSEAFEPLGKISVVPVKILNNIWNVLKKIGEVFRPLAEFMTPMLAEIGSGIANAFGDLDFQDVIETIQTGLFGGLLLTLRRGLKDFGSSTGSAVNRLTGPFAQMTYTLKKMQATLSAMTLMQIAVAIGLLTASAYALSRIDPVALSKALGAMTAMLGQLFTMLAGISRLGGVPGLMGIGAGLILLATGLRIMTSSVTSLAKLEWDEMNRGLTGVTVLIGGLAIAVQAMSGYSKGMVTAGTGLLILAVGIRILASAVNSMSGLSWNELATGLAGVTALLGGLVVAVRLMTGYSKGMIVAGTGLLLISTGIRILATAVTSMAGLEWDELSRGLSGVVILIGGLAVAAQAMSGYSKGMITAGTGLLILSAGLLVLSNAVANMASLDWNELARGLIGVGAVLAGVVLALNMMPPSTMASATAILIVASALTVISSALRSVGGMSWSELAGGLMALGGALLILVMGVNAMTAGMAGAAALLVVATALRVLVPTIMAFGEMNLWEMAKALGMLAGVFVILGFSAVVLTPLVPILFALGAAIMVLGAGVALAGAGTLAFAVALIALAAAAVAGTTAIVGMVSALIGLLPQVARQIALALVAFTEVIAAAGPAMLDAMSVVLGAIIGAIEDNVPDIIELFGNLALQLVEKLAEIVPPMAERALEMMIAVLTQIANNTPTIVAEIIKMVVGILDALKAGVPEMARAGTELIVAVLESIGANIGSVVSAGVDVMIALVEGVLSNINRMVDAGAEAIIKFINGLATTIRNRSEELRGAGRNLASAIISGLTGGLSDQVGRVATAARNVARNALDGAKNFLGIKSPSKEFERLGGWSGEGLANGLYKTAPMIEDAAAYIGEDAVETMKKSIKGMSNLLAMDTNLNPTITPVLDLSEFSKEAKKIDSSLPEPKFEVDVAYTKAKDASSRYRANMSARQETTTATDQEITPAEIVYNQYNTSPKALSSAEIYRQTKNQLSIAKGALTPNVT